MKIAILSDVHGNLEALTAVLEDLDRRSISRVLFLGDVVGYGADPEGCLGLLEKRVHRPVAGNHDRATASDSESLLSFSEEAAAAIRWTRETMTQRARNNLLAWPLDCSEDGMHLVHGSPHGREEWHYIMSQQDADKAFSACAGRLIFIGHSQDFGMAFSNPCFPPFYTMELGISDNTILENRLFLIELITGYAEWVSAQEEPLIRQLEAAYPTSCHADRCRYYLRNYKTHFRIRLYFGRFFEKMRKASFEREPLKGIVEAIDLDMDGLSDWKSLIRTLRDSSRGRLGLRGLDLSDMDLRRADLRGADLKGASLAGADLEGADMRGANLCGVDLTGTNIEDAKLDTT